MLLLSPYPFVRTGSPRRQVSQNHPVYISPHKNEGMLSPRKDFLLLQQQSFKGEPNVELRLYQPHTRDSKGCWETFSTHTSDGIHEKGRATSGPRAAGNKGLGENFQVGNRERGFGFSFLFPICASEHSAINLELYFFVPFVKL